MTFFVDGLAPTTRTIIARFRETESRRELYFDRLLEYSQDQGNGYRTQLVGTRNSTFRTRGPKPTPNVHFVKEPNNQNSDHRQSDGFNMLAPEESVDTKYL